MDNALKVRRGERAAPQADYSGEYPHAILPSMRACLNLSVVAAIVAAGLAGACREAAAPGLEKSAASSTIPSSSRSLSVGDLAPEFSLPGSDGKRYSLASYRGRQPVVLVWFAKAFTEG